MVTLEDLLLGRERQRQNLDTRSEGYSETDWDQKVVLHGRADVLSLSKVAVVSLPLIATATSVANATASYSMMAVIIDPRHCRRVFVVVTMAGECPMMW